MNEITKSVDGNRTSSNMGSSTYGYARMRSDKALSTLDRESIGRCKSFIIDFLYSEQHV